MSIKDLVKRYLGIEEIERESAKQAAEALVIARQAEEAALEARRLQEEAEQQRRQAEQELEELRSKQATEKLSAKERATRNKESWVEVVNTHVDKANISNGFFELDWNEYFIKELIAAGYGTEHDPEEEVVDRWFRGICATVVVDGETVPDTGMLNVAEILRNNGH